MLAYLFVLLAIGFRFLPHPMGFTPVAAALLYFGARGPRRQAWVPLVLFAGADVVLTKWVYAFPTFSADHFVTWAWYAVLLLFGAKSMQQNTSLRIVGGGLFASVGFFAVSNAAVWWVWDMYPRTLNGLMMSYTAGLPFFRNEFASDLFFTAVLFGIGALVQGTAAQKRTAV